MKLIDLSQPIFDECPNCPVHPPVRSQVIADHKADGWRMELLTLASHTGSHVDAPIHKLAGAATLDELPLETFVGKAVLADLRDAKPDQPFTSSMLSVKLRTELEDKIILLATGWGYRRAKSEEWLQRSPYVSPDGAEWLVEQKIRAVGIDHYSIGGSRPEQNARTHEILLQAGVWIVEELFFPPEIFAMTGPFQFWCLPVNLRGHSGAFCRPVIALE